MEARCEECGSRMKAFERGWRGIYAFDPDSDDIEATYYCPVCAVRELDDERPEYSDSPIVGSAHTASADMEFMIEFHRDEADVVITTSGVADPAGFLRCNRALAADSRLRPGMSILLDHTDLDATRLTDDDLREIASSVTAIRHRLGTSRTALVVPDRLTGRLAAITMEHAQPVDLETVIFYSRNEAVDWLAGGP